LFFFTANILVLGGGVVGVNRYNHSGIVVQVTL